MWGRMGGAPTLAFVAPLTSPRKSAYKLIPALSAYRIIRSSRHDGKRHELVPRTREWREHVGLRGEIGMPRVHCLPRVGPLRRRRGETPSRKEMRGRMAGSTAQGSFSKTIRTHTRGAGRKGRGRGGELACTGRHWSASPNPIAKTEATSPRPFLFAIGDSPPASRPPIALAVDSFEHAS
jgi:hypothetical protein